MTQIIIHTAGAVASAEKTGPLTAGMVGVPVDFRLDESWQDLTVTAVFQAGSVARDKPLGEAAAVPWEVLAAPDATLYIGLEGRKADGTLVIPTTWARVGRILAGAATSGNPALDPTPTQYERLQTQMGQIEEALDAILALQGELIGGGEA